VNGDYEDKLQSFQFQNAKKQPVYLKFDLYQTQKEQLLCDNTNIENMATSLPTPPQKIVD